MIKEHLLNRSRLFNPVQLLEFLDTKFLDHFKNKLLSFVSNLAYANKEVKQGLELLEIEGDTAVIEDNGTRIQFSMTGGVCQCAKGSNGKPCEHSYFLSSKNYLVPNEICSHLKNIKEKLYLIATGEILENANYFSSIHSQGTCPESLYTAPPDIEFDDLPDTEPLENERFETGDGVIIYENQVDLETENDEQWTEKKLKVVQRFHNVVDEIAKRLDDKELFSGVENTIKFLETNLKKTFGLPKIVNALKTIESKPINKKIRVQKSSVQRRVCGRTTTTSIVSGRHGNGFLKARKVVAKARMHSFKEAVLNNRQNSGKF